MAALTEPESLDSEDLLKIIKEGRSAMILLQSALAAQQRRMGISSGERPGAELLAAVNAAEESDIPVEMIDRDVVITLRRAWKKMGMIEKWRILNALLWEEDDEEVSIDEVLGDSDLLSSMMEEARELAPRAGEVLIDERDSFLAGRIQQIRGKGKVLAVIGAGHLSGVVQNLGEPAMETTSRLAELSEEPPKSVWPIALMAAIPVFLLGAVGWMAYNGEMEEPKQTAQTWLVLNALLAGLGVLIARATPLYTGWRGSLTNHLPQSDLGSRLVRGLHPAEGSLPDGEGRTGLPEARRDLVILEKQSGEGATGNRTWQCWLDGRRLASGSVNSWHAN